MDDFTMKFAVNNGKTDTTSVQSQNDQQIYLLLRKSNFEDHNSVGIHENMIFSRFWTY